MLEAKEGSYRAAILCDSISSSGVRLTTMEVTLPRFLLAEFNTHRMFSRNSASSRAIPVEKRIKAIEISPYVPAGFARNQKGVQAGEALTQKENEDALQAWYDLRDASILAAQRLAEIGVHKQWANRCLELFAFTTIVVSATEWENFYALRDSSLAQPEFRLVAQLMEEAHKLSEPSLVRLGGWHLPYILPDELASELPFLRLANVSAARCARVSYLTQGGVRDITEDYCLAAMLAGNRHLSPFEHVAQIVEGPYGPADIAFCGNFRAPWVQLRKQMQGEAVAERETK